MRTFFIFCISLYQKFISPLYHPCCRYYPTCSNYAREAIVRHGILKGLILSFLRILRCNPLFSGGFDPVPDKLTIFRSNKVNGQ